MSVGPVLDNRRVVSFAVAPGAVLLSLVAALRLDGQTLGEQEVHDGFGLEAEMTVGKYVDDVQS